MWHFNWEDDEHIGFNDEDLLELNRQSSITQQSVSKIEGLEDEHATPVAHFSFPFDWQFIVPEDYIDGKWPTLLFQVNALDSWERYTIEGYGFVEIPRTAGYHEITVQTWKPHQSLSARLHTFFLGGSIKVKELKEIAHSQGRSDSDQDTILNRFGVTSESSGSVKFHINVAKQSETLLQKYKSEHQDIKHREKLENLKTKEPEFQYNVDAPALMQTAMGKIGRF